jgi:hypothetical protein
VAGVTIDDLMREALTLDPQGRARLAHRLLDSLDELSEAEVEQLWLAEAVRRDAEIAVLGAVGSGYPSDPVTRAWLRGFIDRAEPFPPCVRTRWATLDNLRQQPLLGG